MGIGLLGFSDDVDDSHSPPRIAATTHGAIRLIDTQNEGTVQGKGESSIHGLVRYCKNIGFSPGSGRMRVNLYICGSPQPLHSGNRLRET